MPTARYPMHDHGLFVMAMQAQADVKNNHHRITQQIIYHMIVLVMLFKNMQ